AEAGEKVDARDTGELAVRLEQLRRLPALDRAPADRAQELDETEVADEAVIPAAEALEADDADRPRPEPPLPLEPSHDRVRRPALQSPDLNRAAEADECCGAARVETQLSQLRRRQRTEVARRWGGVQALGPAGADRADDRLLHSARALRLDQLPAEGAQKRLRNGGDAYGTEAAQVARRAPEHAVVAHTHEKRRVVVVQREQPAETLCRRRRLGTNRHRSRGRLPRARQLDAPVDRERLREQAVAKRARRVARQTGGECERVRAARRDRELEAHRSAFACCGAARMPSSAARSRASIASASRPMLRSRLPKARPVFAAACQRFSASRMSTASMYAALASSFSPLSVRASASAARANPRSTGDDSIARASRANAAAASASRRMPAMRDRWIVTSMRSPVAGATPRSFSARSRCVDASSAFSRSMRRREARTCARPRLSASSVVSSSAIALRMFESARDGRPSASASRANDQYRRTRMYGSSLSAVRARAVRTTCSARATSPTSVSA